MVWQNLLFRPVSRRSTIRPTGFNADLNCSLVGLHSQHLTVSKSATGLDVHGVGCEDAFTRQA